MTSLTFVPLSLVGDEVQSARRAASASPPIVFGREAVLLDAVDEAAGLASHLPARRRQLAAGKILAAVVQKGRLFERAHPDVTVLRNRGRFLLVELSPDHPALAERTDEPCYATYRVEPGTEVFRDLRLGGLSARRDPAVEAVLERLSAMTFREVLGDLVALRTRLSTSAFYGEAAQMCRGRLEALGYETTIQDFTMAGGRSSNVLAATAGGSPSTALVVGHLDSANHVDGPDGNAPGADDNGSGSAGVIAMAEALVAVQDRIGVGFVLFGGEEQGLHGSKHLVARLSAEQRAALRAVINMDMIANLNTLPDGTTVPPGVLLEGADVSRKVIEDLSVQAASYTDLAVQTSFNPFASDHVPFIQAGLPAVLTIEGADQANDRIHSAADVLDRIDDGLAFQILRMNTAYLALQVGT